MICPTCQNEIIQSEPEWKGNIKYKCSDSCTVLAYEHSRLKSYILTQNIEDKNNTNLSYKVLAMNTISLPMVTLWERPMVTLWESDKAFPDKPLNKMILRINHFIDIANQEELNGLIDRLLNLRAFS